ncbi:MAG TPA: hypothetical protein DCY94_02280 [Firmicutes bacterium]|nr:hypothetical protein [Bacillota bacterium]
MKFKKGNKACIIPNHHGDIPQDTLHQIIKTTRINIKL